MMPGYALLRCLTLVFAITVQATGALAGSQLLSDEEITKRQQHVLERLQKLNHSKLLMTLKNLNVDRPDGFLGCMCNTYSITGVGIRYHPEPEGDCDNSLPCKGGNWGCVAHDLPTDPEAWKRCVESSLITLPPDSLGNQEQIRLDALIERKLRYRNAYRPCPEADFFYDEETVYNSFNGKPALNYTRDDYSKRFIEKAKQWERETGKSLSSSAGLTDAAKYALTFINSSLPTGREAELHACARSHFESTGKRMEPDEYFLCALRLSDGDVNKALVMAHASLERHNKDNKPVVDDYLAPIRNPDAYPAEANVKIWNAQLKRYETASPAATTGPDQQGVWYHLFGMAAVELADGESMGFNTLATVLGDESYDFLSGLETGMTDNMPGAGALIDWLKTFLPGTPGLREMAADLLRKGYPNSNTCGSLANFSIALENEFRVTKTRSVPDPAKQCTNYDGCGTGKALFEWMLANRLLKEPPHE